MDDTKLISSLPVGIFQEATQDDLLIFWTALVFGIVFGILLFGSLIAGLLKWARKSKSLLGINIEDNLVYGSRVQDKAALSAEKGQNLAPVKETKCCIYVCLQNFLNDYLYCKKKIKSWDFKNELIMI